MKKAMVFSSGSGNTKQLAVEICGTLGEMAYCGAPSDEALEADVIFVGSWTMGFNCVPPIKEFLQKLNGKKVFLFMTAGYGNTPEFFAPILAAAKEHINSSNEIIGEYICQGKVSDAKKEAIKKADAEKFAAMEAMLTESNAHPNAEDIKALVHLVKALPL